MILVTGATGLVGSEVCRMLEKQSAQFRALKRSESDISLCHNIDIDWVDGDVLDIPSLDDALQNIDTVIHCAAIVSYDKRQVNEMMNVNVSGTHNIVNCSLANNVSNLIHVSSIAALGRNKEADVITEETLWVDSPLNTNYAKSKYLSEIEVWRGESEGLNVSVVNPSVVLTSGDGQRSSSKLLQYIWDEHWFYIDKKLNYVDVLDVASAIITLYNNQVWGRKYILNAGTISYKNIFIDLANRLHRKTPKVNVSHQYLEAGLIISKLWSFISNRPQIISRELMKTMKTDFTYSGTKICRDLTFEYTDYEKTIDRISSEFLKIIASK